MTPAKRQSREDSRSRPSELPRALAGKTCAAISMSKKRRNHISLYCIIYTAFHAFNLGSIGKPCMLEPRKPGSGEGRLRSVG